ncbi:TadE/TadG family type IV pilus assembly protein [Bythopirellula polymerisocia]|uniref:TadE-like protein n=1 Tax=Bythopirellula polymerisocia TaxID=2528003 RepID=A0A5C6CXS8_9BACT|nr:TadE/TadG family type IV pilus assembly protein [Bythopirellula polymerisocia]TWU28337.1 TadE-like protein [Bythopirellula polymerisocia]
MSCINRNRSKAPRRKDVRRRLGRKRRGTATVEFALIAPLFFMLVLGCIELSRGLMVQQVLTNASRVGVRNAVMLSGTQSSAVSAATNFANGASVGGIEVSVTPDPSDASAGDMISLTVSVPFANVSWVPAPKFLGGTTLTATSVMRKEGFE